MREIREIYQSWLEGDLSQEDALFAIGDALDQRDREAAPYEQAADHSATIRKQSS